MPSEFVKAMRIKNKRANKKQIERIKNKSLLVYLIQHFVNNIKQTEKKIKDDYYIKHHYRKRNCFYFKSSYF